MSDILLTVDPVVTINNEKILLVRRGQEPDIGKLALPGGHVDLADLSVKHACARELKEETGLVVGLGDLKFMVILDNPGRDPRPDRRISIVYKVDLPSEDLLRNCKAGSDAKDLVVKKIDELKSEDMAVDHWEVIKIIKKSAS